jgi:hypothetical protein
MRTTLLLVILGSLSAWSAPMIVEGGPNQSDQNIAAGEKYVLIGDYNTFEVWDSINNKKVPLTGTELQNNAAPFQAVEGGGAATLFQIFWTGTSSHNY